MNEEKLNSEGSEETLKENKQEFSWEQSYQGSYQQITPTYQGECHGSAQNQNSGSPQPAYGQNTYGQNGYQPNAQGQNGYQSNTYGQNEHQPNAYGQNNYQPNVQGQNSYQQNAHQQNSQEPVKPVSQGLGIASMILGILSLALFCTCVNIPLSITAIILGIVQLFKAGSKKGMAITGIITSCLSIVAWIIFIIAFVTSTDFQEGFERGWEDGIGNDFFYEYSFPDDFNQRNFDNTF